MSAQIEAEMSILAAACQVSKCEPVNGWTIDIWIMASETIDALIDAYRKLLMPVESRMKILLARSGIDVEKIFIQPDNASDRLSRADMVELAAAASTIAVEQLPLELMVLANAPKQSRRKSESGLDVMCVTLDLDSTDDSFGRTEFLYIGSVKHSISSSSDLRNKLESSLSEKEISVEYLAEQLRVLSARLIERGIERDKAQRVFLALGHEPLLNPSIIKLIAIGAVDSYRIDELAGQLALLHPSELGLRHFRQIVIDGLDTLHARV